MVDVSDCTGHSRKSSLARTASESRATSGSRSSSESRAARTSRASSDSRKDTWTRVKLGEVCEVRAGTDYKQVKSESGKYPIYGTGGVMGYATDFRCPANSVIVGRKGTLDNPMLIEEPFWNIDTCFGVIPSGRISPRYLHRFCQSFDFYSLVPAIGRPSTTSDAVREIELPLPPLAVQHEIVARLEKDLAMVERMAKGFAALKTEADQLFKSTLKETFEEVSRGGAETRRSKLDNVCELIADCPHTTAKNEGKGFPLVRTPNVGYTRLIYENMHRVSEEVYASRTSRGVPMEGDLIFAREAPAGNVAVIQKGEVVCLGQRTVLLRLKSGVAVPDYMAWYILSPEIQKTLLKCSYGATVAHVNVKDIRDLEVGIPPLPTQREIVAKLDAVRGRCEKLKHAAEEGLQTAALMRKAILKEAFA